MHSLLRVTVTGDATLFEQLPAIGYIRLAREGQHLIDQENEETIYLPDGKALTVPRVVFLPK